MPVPHRLRGATLAAMLLPLSLVQAHGQDGMPPAEVGVVVATPGAHPVLSVLPGRISPTRIAEVRARVDGIVLERVFAQGTTVDAGQVLFRIDPVKYEVAVAAARAGVARAEAVLANARSTEARQESLIARNVTSKAELDSAVAQRMQAEADLAAARATLQGAEIDLGFTEVTAPIAGSVGRAMVTEGALLQSGSSEILTTIQNLDRVYADIQQPVSELLKLRKALATGALEQLEPGIAKVRLILDDGTEYPATGRLLFSETSVDPNSGQVALRAEFPNESGMLLPGMYVRVMVEQGLERDVITVPSQAIQRGPGGQTFLYVVGADDTIAYRPVTLGRVIAHDTVIDSGLSAGERVVVDGVQKIGPDMAVTVADWSAPIAAQDRQVAN